MTLDPGECVDKFGVIYKDNYLAHTIRALEHYILKETGRPFHILTRRSQIRDKTKCEFFDRGCIIRLPDDVEERDACEIRVRLAHELGHIIWVINQLRNPESLKDATIEEEIFAWRFAHGLIMRKSADYANPDFKNFVFKPERVKATIEGVLSRDKEEGKSGAVWQYLAKKL